MEKGFRKEVEVFAKIWGR